MYNTLPLDGILSFCREIIPGHGEDSSCYCFCDTAGLLGVFDGCGGAGARKHAYYSNFTEAFIASRIASGAFYDSFRQAFPCQMSAQQAVDTLFTPTVNQRLTDYAPPKNPDGIDIRGSMIRTLPSTAAAAMVQLAPDGSLLVSAIWAGDSRVYLLDSSGLAQLSIDDTSVPDPMENLYEDGILRNILSADKPFSFHCQTVRVQPPFAVFAATDGCFGYVSTPMEFEGILLGTLLDASSLEQWENRLAETIRSIAGDDHTMVLAAFGYGSFSAIQQSLYPRYQYLQPNYLQPVSQFPLEDRQSRYALWAQYKNNYFRYLKNYSGYTKDGNV